jgi:hypothetical protein
MGRMKDGNKKIRWILIQAANTAARKDDRLLGKLIERPISFMDRASY